MVNIIGADGRKPIHVQEKELLEHLKGDSVARESGSVPQTFNRIRSISYHDGFFELELKPDPLDLTTHRTVSAAEMFHKIDRMKLSLAKMPLVDPKMAAEMLTELERKLYEAMEKDEKALKEIQQAIIEGENLKKAREMEDRVNGIIR